VLPKCGLEFRSRVLKCIRTKVAIHCGSEASRG
jgi:hypothetical protein